MAVSKDYCMSSYLTLRYIPNEDTNFFEGLSHKVFTPKQEFELTKCKTVDDIDRRIKQIIDEEYIPHKTAILLSGGMDSAILASYLPKGTTAYTFKCVAEGAIDETEQAKKYADAYGLNHKIIEMHWQDFEELTPKIIEDAQVPVHSIEVQLYKAALIAKSEGIEKFIIGAIADLIFGGMDKLLAKDWNFDEFVDRYTFVNPQNVLKSSVPINEVFETYRINSDKIDFLKFMDDISSIESSTSYMHAFKMAGIKYVDPYSFFQMSEPLNLNRVRNGEPKYLIRELFAKKYPDISVPNKIPMPRATEQWLSEWPKSALRDEFLPGCTKDLSGDQKWLIYCLEQYLNIFDKVKAKI